MDRWHLQRHNTIGSSAVVTSSVRTTKTRITSVGRAENTASFHSTPLSRSTAEAEEATASAASEESSPEDAQNGEEQSATDVTYNIAPAAPLSKASQEKVQSIFEKVLWLDMIEAQV